MTNKLPGGPPLCPASPRPETCICMPSSTPGGILTSTDLQDSSRRNARVRYSQPFPYVSMNTMTSHQHRHNAATPHAFLNHPNLCPKHTFAPFACRPLSMSCMGSQSPVLCPHTCGRWSPYGRIPSPGTPVYVRTKIHCDRAHHPGSRTEYSRSQGGRGPRKNQGRGTQELSRPKWIEHLNPLAELIIQRWNH